MLQSQIQLPPDDGEASLFKLIGVVMDLDAGSQEGQLNSLFFIYPRQPVSLDKETFTHRPISDGSQIGRRFSCHQPLVTQLTLNFAILVCHLKTYH